MEKNPETCLVGGIPTTLKNMSSSVGMMKFPTYGKSSNSMVPNHQPVVYIGSMYDRPIPRHSLSLRGERTIPDPLDADFG